MSNLTMPDLIPYARKPSKNIIVYPWMQIAWEEYNRKVREVQGKKHNPRIVLYHSYTTLKATTDEVPWCSSGMNFLVARSGYEPTRSAAARSWLNFGVEIEDPFYSCIMVFKRGTSSWAGHVALLVAELEDHYLCLGGNQSNTWTVAPYPKKDLLGARGV